MTANKLCFEGEPLIDALFTIAQARVAASGRRGAAFRSLERRLDAALADMACDSARHAFDLVPLDAEHVVAVPALHLRALQRDARELGVIR